MKIPITDKLFINEQSVLGQTILGNNPCYFDLKTQLFLQYNV
jgi:hypothetical protein